MTQTMFSTPDYNLNPFMIDREQCSWLLPLISANSQRLTLLASRLRLGERLQREAMAASQSLLLSKLPDRVICHILSHLDNYEDIANASNINHRFREAASTTEAKIAWMLNQPDALVGWARRKITTRPDHVAAWVERVSKTSAARSRQSSSGSWPNLKPSVRRRSGSDGWILGNENEDDHELVVKVGVVDSILGRRPEVCVAMFEVLLSGILEASENLPSTVPKQDAKVGSYAADIELNQKNFCMRIKKEGCIDVYKAIWSTLCKGLQVGPILKQIVQDDSAAVTHTLSADPSGAVTPRPIAGFSDKKKHPILSSALDESSWREAVYMGITIHEESPMLLRCLISRFSMKPSTEPTFDSTTPDIKKFAKDAPVLAGQLGRLGALKEMVEGLSWDLDDDESDRTSGKGGGCDVLKAAASAGHWPVVLYVVGQTGFSEHHEGLVYTYRGLYILCQCGEHRTFDAVMTVLDGWRADEANSHEDLTGTVRKSSSDQIDANIPNTRLFSMRWRVAMEMACEKGLSDLVTFLCEQRKGKREIETLIPTTRMFALALCNGHHHTANVVLCLRAADDLSKTPTSNTLNQVTSKPSQPNATDARNSILETTWDHKDILSGGVCQYQEWTKLAIRYCVIAAEDLAPQLGLDVPATSSRTQRNLQNDPPSLQASFDMISMEAWRATTEKHRAIAIRFFFETAPKPMHVHPKLGEEMMWAAMRAGNIDAAYEIRDAGDAVKIGWMESAPAILSTSRAATRRISGVATHDSSAFDYGGTVPPAAAMVLLSALGGTWVTPLPANTIKVSSSTNSGSITTSSKTSLDLGAILIAAEMSRSGAKFDAGHCETVAETLSNDSSFVETFVSRPHMIRQIMNVDDNNWTAFLAGKLGEVKGKEDEEVPMTLSWMEPAQLAGGKTLSGSGSMSSTEWQAPSRSDFGNDFDENNPELLQVFLGLGGSLPERKVSKSRKTKPLQRVIESGM